MRVTEFSDNKSTPSGTQIAMAEGSGIYTCRGMTYWLRWRDHTFDIRVMWELLGMEEQKYFIGEDSRDWKVNPDFYTGFVSGIEGKDFGELMRLHDCKLEAEQ